MRLGRKIALGFVSMSLLALIAPGAVSAEVGPREVYIDKTLQTGEPGYYSPGDTVVYRYEVTANDAFTILAVTDDKCSPVVPVLAVDGYNVGDIYGTKGVLNGFAGDKWVYTCSEVLPATPPAPDGTYTNTATVTANSIWPQHPGVFSDTDAFTLKGAILRKIVALFWDYSHYVAYPPAANVAFAVDVYLGATKVGTETVKASDPLELWFGPGTWKLQEQTPAAPYTMVPGRGTWNDVTAGTWRDNTFFNLIAFDLSVEKSGPLYRFAGQSVTYEYTVKNDGPAVVKPVVTDDKCSPVAYASGDANTDLLIQTTETWTFTCTTTPDWATVFNAGSPWRLKNTARVVADEAPEAWTPIYGGDSDPDNDIDTYKLYAFVLRKDVGLYTNGEFPDFAAFSDATPFTVKMYLDGTYKATFTIAEGAPMYLWLSAGTWKFREVDLRDGYMAFYPNASITFATGSGYPDWTHLNVTWSGCSHGHWKNTTPWPGGILPTALVGTYFPESDFYDGATLAEALAFGGGSGQEGAERNLLKQAVGALLNETGYGSAFGPYVGVDALKAAVNSALASNSRTQMLSLAGRLDDWNNGVCR